MSPKLINLTLPVVTEKIENVLEEYPQYPYQIAFSLPGLRQMLLAHVLTHTPNRYTVAGDKLTPKDPKFPYPSSVQERVRMENLIHGSILHILWENAEWVGYQITQMVNSDCTPRESLDKGEHLCNNTRVSTFI